MKQGISWDVPDIEAKYLLWYSCQRGSWLTLKLKMFKNTNVIAVFQSFWSWWGCWCVFFDAL